MADAASGTYGILRLVAAIAGSSAAGKYTDVSWWMYHIENGSTNQQFNGDGVSAAVGVATVGTVYSGGFTFDWRPGGNQSVLIASGTTRVYHNADGTPPAGFYVSGSIGDTGSNGAGRGASVVEYLSLPTLTVIPDSPTGLAASRVSDTSIDLAWSQPATPTNGRPTSVTVRRAVNGGAFGDVVTIAPATSVNVSAAANQKLVFQVVATNSQGSATSAISNAVYTTPAAPTGVVATKVGSDIALAWTPAVAFAEHQHVIEHGVDVAGVVTWDASPLATVASGTSSYTHAAPNPAQRHVYRVRARNTDVGALSSATVQSNVVQLLTAPAKPTVPAPAPFQNKAAAFRFAWVHNAIDSSAQTKRQARYSLDGGTTWTTGAKTASTDQFLDYAASTWAANAAVTFQVRTKGSYDSGADGDASYSPWSDSVTVTFKTKPVATITTPANASTVTTAALNVVLGFSQAEAATFVNATVGLYQGVTLLEEIVSTTLAGTAFATRLADGGSYTVKAVVRDSNGLDSSQVSSTFSVDYTEPVAAVVAVQYLRDSGIAQIALTIPGAGGGLVAATTVSIDRVIDGVSEPIVVGYPKAPALTFLDTTPTIHGTNLYRVTTRSADGATTVVEATLVTDEMYWAFLSSGDGYSEIVKFGGNLTLDSSPKTDAAQLKAAGRRRPIGLYGTGGSLDVSGKAAIVTGEGSTPEEVEAFFLTAKRSCYRDPTGRRLFGQVTGSISRSNAALASVSYTITETS